MRKHRTKSRIRKPTQQHQPEREPTKLYQEAAVEFLHVKSTIHSLKRKLQDTHEIESKKWHRMADKAMQGDANISAGPTSRCDQMRPRCDDEHRATTNSVQITSIDGFFNRKRGRPPKNRFVEVYKNAQQSPQAIFTSFKLDQGSKQAIDRELVALTVDSGQIDDAVETLQYRSIPGRPSTMVPKMYAKEYVDQFGAERKTKNCLMRQNAGIFTVKGDSQVVRNRNKDNFAGTMKAPLNCSKSRAIASTDYHQRDAAECDNRAAHKVSVVRAAGTFYPENIKSDVVCSVNTSQTKPLRTTSPEVERLRDDFMPEGAIDLRVITDRQESLPQNCREQRSDPPATETAVLHNMAIQHLKQVFQFYQIQQELQKHHQPFVGEATTPLQVFMQLSEMATDVASSVGAVAEQDRCPYAAADSGPAPSKPKNEGVPEGYSKFRHNENCGYPTCGYCERQSHFHCIRSGCPYVFCDKARFVQHTARHERLDSLMGQDFVQYRANVNCGRANCTFYNLPAAAKKPTHFHCVKCEFACADTNKLTAHRRFHYRMEYIRRAGFRKVANTENCKPEGQLPNDHNSCPYNLKQTHYHCLSCDYSVMARSQFAHKHDSPTENSN